MRKSFLGFGVIIALACTAALVLAQRPEHVEAVQEPPAFVVEAWERGEAPVPENGPPAWVIESWTNGEHLRAGGGFGPPKWVQERHVMGQELGLPGPPPEVIEAWQNGEGFDLPGPPDFVLDLLGL